MSTINHYQTQTQIDPVQWFCLLFCYGAKLCSVDNAKVRFQQKLLFGVKRGHWIAYIGAIGALGLATNLSFELISIIVVAFPGIWSLFFAACQTRDRIESNAIQHFTLEAAKQFLTHLLTEGRRRQAVKLRCVALKINNYPSDAMERILASTSSRLSHHALSPRLLPTPHIKSRALQLAAN